MKPMLACGHAANATDGHGNPSCAICVGIAPTHVVETPTLAGRIAKCGCGATQPSDSPDLAFFEYRWPGSRSATDQCVCGYYRMAHGAPHIKCSDFQPRGDQHDLYYCGCRGWD